MNQIESTQEFVVQALCSACSLDRANVTLQTPLQSTGLDSLSLTAIVARVEAGYACELSSDQIMDLFQALTVGDLVERLTIAATTPNHVAHG